MNHLRNRQFGLYRASRPLPELLDDHIQHIRHNVAAFLYTEHTNKASEEYVYHSPNDIVEDVTITSQNDEHELLIFTTITVRHPDSRLMTPQQAIAVTGAEKTMVLISGSRSFAQMLVQVFELMPLTPPMMIHRLKLSSGALLHVLENVGPADVHLVYVVKTTNDALRLIKVTVSQADYEEMGRLGSVAEGLQRYMLKNSGINFANLELALVATSTTSVLQSRVTMEEPMRIILVLMEEREVEEKE